MIDAGELSGSQAVSEPSYDFDLTKYFAFDSEATEALAIDTDSWPEEEFGTYYVSIEATTTGGVKAYSTLEVIVSEKYTYVNQAPTIVGLTAKELTITNDKTQVI